MKKKSENFGKSKIKKFDIRLIKTGQTKGKEEDDKKGFRDESKK